MDHKESVEYVKKKLDLAYSAIISLIPPELRGTNDCDALMDAYNYGLLNALKGKKFNSVDLYTTELNNLVPRRPKESEEQELSSIIDKLEMPFAEHDIPTLRHMWIRVATMDLYQNGVPDAVCALNYITSAIKYIELRYPNVCYDTGCVCYDIDEKNRSIFLPRDKANDLSERGALLRIAKDMAEKAPSHVGGLIRRNKVKDLVRLRAVAYNKNTDSVCWRDGNTDIWHVWAAEHTLITLALRSVE